MAMRVQLVSQYLENISREALETHQDLIRQYIRRRQGVYALYRKGSLWYVGLAGNLSRRLKDHLRDRHKESWDRFSVYLTMGATNMKEMESLLLRVVVPPGNRSKGRFLRAENLRQRLAADIRRRQRERLDSLIGRPKRAPTRTSARETKQKVKSSAPLAPYVTGPTPIRARYKGRRIRARMINNDLYAKEATKRLGIDIIKVLAGVNRFEYNTTAESISRYQEAVQNEEDHTASLQQSLQDIDRLLIGLYKALSKMKQVENFHILIQNLYGIKIAQEKLRQMTQDIAERKALEGLKKPKKLKKP